MRLRVLLTVAAALALAAALPSSAISETVSAKRDTTATATTTSESPVPVAESTTRLPGRRLTSDQVVAIAERLPTMRAARREYPGAYPGVYTKGPARWQVSFFSKKGAKEIGQVIVADATGRVLEQWTGWQVAWTMARGYPGAFGRHVNALYVWLPLCVLFLLPFIDPRRPLQLLHLDLLVLLSFSVSLAFFNHAHIYASVPLAYPPLIYLLGRMLWLLRRPRAGSRSSGRPARPLRLLVPTSWLLFGLVFLIGFRVALNVTDSNVIDVGYAGVIGAEKIVHDDPLYGGWPSDNEHGDTYGPVNYEAYIPFEQIFGWSGTWDDLPAAHAAAIVFDLLAIALMFLLGWRARGPTLGIALAYAWASYPFTLFALESNSNDTLVAVFLLAALLAASSPPARGVFAALAGLTKFAPLALAPVLATHRLLRSDDGQGARSRARALRSLLKFAIAFALTAALVSIPALTHDSLQTIYNRTIAYQAERGAPFSVWGLYAPSPALHDLEMIVEAVAVALALGLAVVPRRADVFGLAAACAAILIATQLGIEYWFYLYITWFFPLVMFVLIGVRMPERAPLAGHGGTTTAGSPPLPAPLQSPFPRPQAPARGAASGSARLRLPSAAWRHSG